MLNIILFSQPFSWLIHFAMFFVLQRYSGIKWQWSVLLVFAIELWEMIDWSLDDPFAWFMMLDTWMDIMFGSIAIFISLKIRRS